MMKKTTLLAFILVLYSFSVIEETKAIHEVVLTYMIKNFLIAPEKYCEVELKFKQSND